MPTDHVCNNMVIDGATLTCRIHYKGQEYFFCPDFCRKMCEENPTRYATLARSMDLGPDIRC